MLAAGLFHYRLPIAAIPGPCPPVLFRYLCPTARRPRRRNSTEAVYLGSYLMRMFIVPSISPLL